MLEKDEFERWIEASHMMFEIFEGRYDAYPLAKKWVQEWFSCGNFSVEKENVERIFTLIENFDYEVYGVKGESKERIDGMFKNFLRNNLGIGKNKNVGFAVSPYLFTWNFQRFKEYFMKQPDFNIEQYFRKLGDFLKKLKNDLEKFNDRRLIFDPLGREEIVEIFDQVNNKLKEIGIEYNEPVGTIKLLHIFAPYYFPLIDGDIAETVGLIHYYFNGGRRRRESLTSDSYFKWMNALKIWLQRYSDMVEKLENKHNFSILKLVDEGLYMMSTVRQRARVVELGIEVK
jgi:hypothetical protein